MLLRLSEFARNRCLAEVQDTFFLHDRFHGSAHIKCADMCFNPDRVDPNGACNTSLMEQKNSVLAPLRTMFANVKLPMAHVLMQLSIGLLNYREARDAKFPFELKVAVSPASSV